MSVVSIVARCGFVLCWTTKIRKSTFCYCRVKRRLSCCVWMTETTAPLLSCWTPRTNSLIKSSISISSYNMLAQVYVNTTQFPYCPRRFLRRKHRLALTKELLQSLQVDILCLQEVDCYNELETWLGEKGYKGVFQIRGGTKKDGCAIFFQSDKLELMAQHYW